MQEKQLDFFSITNIKLNYQSSIEFELQGVKLPESILTHVGKQALELLDKEIKRYKEKAA
jgi:hypothetical protein